MAKRQALRRRDTAVPDFRPIPIQPPSRRAAEPPSRLGSQGLAESRVKWICSFPIVGGMVGCAVGMLVAMWFDAGGLVSAIELDAALGAISGAVLGVGGALAFAVPGSIDQPAGSAASLDGDSR